MGLIYLFIYLGFVPEYYFVYTFLKCWKGKTKLEDILLCVACSVFPFSTQFWKDIGVSHCPLI